MASTAEKPAMAKKPVIIHGHPALLKWTPPRTHALNATQFEALTAISDAFIPSLPPPFKDGEPYATIQGVTPEDVARFFKLKASDEDIVDVVRFRHRKLVRTYQTNFRDGNENIMILYLGMHCNSKFSKQNL